MTKRIRNVTTLAAAALILAVSGPAAFAASQDYRFEPVHAKVQASNGAPVAVRLVHVPTGKAVADAIIIQQKIEMQMQGMAAMAGQVSGLKSDGKGNYAGTADLSMTGDWVLALAAKVPGEADTVRGTVKISVEK